MMTSIPQNYTRVRLLKPVEYARDILPAGTFAVVDLSTARRWIEVKLAEAAPAPPAGPQLWPSCPRCGLQFPIAETLEPERRWVSCPNARCGHGWLR